MKILMLGWELPPHNSGGLGVACLNLSKSLAGLGEVIDFVVPYTSDHDFDFMRVLSATAVSPKYLYGKGTSYESARVEEKFLTNGDGGFSIRDLQREYCAFIRNYLAENKPDIVHAHDWLTIEAGIIAKEEFGIPLVVHVHATEFDRGGESGGNPLIRQIESEGFRKADRILAVSQATKDILVEKYGIEAERIEVVYNGFIAPSNDNYYYDESNYAYLEGLKEEGYTLVSTVGRFTMQKGLFHLLRAAARAISVHPKMLFIFAGDGEQREELMHVSAELGISQNIIFTGFVRGDKLRDVYSLSNVFVMSSISEPFGLTALEAAHHGNALIITKQSGVGEVLDSIIQYDFWDEDKLAGALINIAESPALTSTLQDGVGREYMRISWDDVAQKCIEVYHIIHK